MTGLAMIALMATVHLGWDGEKDKELVRDAARALEALPEDDPRFAEAHCRVVQELGLDYALREQLLKRAMAQQEKSGDPATRYLLPEATVLVEAHWQLDGMMVLESTLMPTQYPSWCREANHTLLWLMLVDGYESYGMARGYGPSSSVTAPEQKGGYAAAAREFVALSRAVKKALGSEHPLVATLLDHSIAYCDKTRRRSAPGHCPSQLGALKRSLDIRKKGLPAHHPLIAASQLNLGNHWLLRGKDDLAEPLFRVAMAGLDHPWRYLAAVQLTGLLLKQGKKQEALALSEQAVAAASRLFAQGSWESDHAASWHEEVRRHAGVSPESSDSPNVKQ